jgi:translation initiation factor 2 subunit 2
MDNNEQPQLTLDMDENELYIYLLENIYDTINKNSNLSCNSEIKVAKPEAYFDVTKKTIWTNFRYICKELKSNEEHVANYISKEHRVDLSINKEGQLLIKGRFSDLKIGSTLKNYIKNYLQCIACKTLNTSIEKKPNKLTYLICNNQNCKFEKVIKY